MTSRMRRSTLTALLASSLSLSLAVSAGAAPLSPAAHRHPPPAGRLTRNPPAAPVDTVHYFGGRVISNVKVVEVAWGASVSASYLTKLQGFYEAIVKSPFIDWMTEYDTIGKTGDDGQPGSAQHIGRGSFGGLVVISPKNAATTLDDTDIQAELAAQLDAGALPPPSLDAKGNVDSLYMFDFAPGYLISEQGDYSCQAFDAYHYTINYKGMSVPYGVHPDCGDPFEYKTLVHSHELAEAITDAEIGLVTGANVARPAAWMSVGANAGEVGDLCDSTQASVAGYTVQKIWSNYAGGCVSEIPICDGAASPPACRTCTAFDEGNACSGATPACATKGASAGKCVTCSSEAAQACTGATPACDDATNTCVACVSDASCTGATPVCDTSAHTCHGCSGDAQCGAGKVCDQSGDAMHGACVACTSDAQCPGQQCNLTSHACQSAPPPSQTGGGGANAGDGSGSDGGSGCGIGGAPKAEPKDAVLALFSAVFLLASRRRRRAT